MNRFSEYLSRRLPFFYGYIMVVVAVLAQVCSSPGQTFAISAFTPFLQEDLGMSASRLAAAYMFGTLLAALPLAMIGPLSDRFGLRLSMTGTAIGLALACVITSAATGFFTLLLGFLLLRCLGQGALTLLGSNIVSMWFQKRLGTVNAIMSAGGAAAFAIVPLVLLTAIEFLGWRLTYLCMGASILVTLVPMLILVLRNRPEDLGLSLDGVLLGSAIHESDPRRETTTRLFGVRGPELTFRDAVRHRTFWILAVGMAMWAMVGTGIVFYALPIFDEQGISQDRSKMLFATFSMSMLLLQVIGGVLADRLPMHRLLAFGFLLLAAGASIIPLTTHVWHVHCFAALFGAGQGLAISVNSTMWVRYYGRKNLGKIRGTVWSTTVACSGAGPFVLGVIHDSWGSFIPGLWAFAAMLLPLAPLSAWATAPQATDPDDDPTMVEPESQFIDRQTLDADTRLPTSGSRATGN